MEIQFSRQIFKKYSNIKFHENPSSGSRVVACGRADGPTDMTKLVVPFRNCANAPEKCFHVVSLRNAFHLSPTCLRQQSREVLDGA